MNTQCDIAIIGGGPVGAALALALKDSPFTICVLEARSAQSPSRDARALALSYGSRLLLERLNVWDKLQDVSSIATIHISQKQSFGRAILRAGEMNVPDLGYVLPYAMLQDALTHQLQEAFNGQDDGIIFDAGVTHLCGETDHAVIRYQLNGVEHTLQARLAVVADGGKLLALSFPPDVHDYGQSALIAHITCAEPVPGTAFERFTPQGPIALLPCKDGYEIVWTASHQKVAQMLLWEDAQFLQQLHEHFGDRVGAFLTVSTKTAYPLGLRRAPKQSPMPHTVLLGNAAQTMHPVAGQGFNLGLRDAWDMAQVILDADLLALGTEAMLDAYRQQRQLDRNAGIRFTDSLVRLFSNDLPLLRSARAASLSVLDCLPFAKHFVAKRMMFGANG
jgi:2-octaprenyl-6-methoxyphenol hydroxylase